MHDICTTRCELVCTISLGGLAQSSLRESALCWLVLSSIFAFCKRIPCAAQGDERLPHASQGQPTLLLLLCCCVRAIAVHMHNALMYPGSLIK